MKKITLLLLALILTACTSATEAPVAAPTEVPPTATPVVIVQTVVVEATQAPTDVPPPTQVPPTAAPVVVTVVVEPTQAPVTQAPADPNAVVSSEVSFDNALGGGYFLNMKASSDKFSLRCFPLDVTFSFQSTNPTIVDVEVWYRLEDRQGTGITEWKNGGKMTSDNNGNFSRVFKGEDVNADARMDYAWFDVQFIGLAKSGDVVTRSEKIVQKLTYTIDCK